MCLSNRRLQWTLSEPRRTGRCSAGQSRLVPHGKVRVCLLLSIIGHRKHQHLVVIYAEGSTNLPARLLPADKIIEHNTVVKYFGALAVRP